MRKLPAFCIVAVCGIATLVWSIGLARGAAEAARDTSVTTAVCIVHGLDDGDIVGTVTFTQRDGFVEVAAEIKGLPTGLHGFHIHEFGDCSMADGMCAGGHFNPTNMPHGGPESARHHAGDLGNLKADQSGVARFQLKDELISLSGSHSIIGRSIIIHEKVDDFTTQPAGDAGKRIACGVIGIAKPD